MDDVRGNDEDERGTYGEMDSPKEIFDDSGPIHLKIVDWTNIHHQRTVAASLVQGVYILQLDHEHKRQGKEAQAPRWWEFFNFTLCDPIFDADHSICGAIFESNTSAFTAGAPKYVIAFRGTGTGEARLQDLKLDVLVIINRLQKCRRFQRAIEVVRAKVNAAGGSKIWLAGHSLGAAIATLAGKNMAKNDIYLETFLFNSPFIWAPPTEWIKSKTLNKGIHITKSFITAGLTVAMKKGHSQASGSNDSFAALSKWVPNLFLNPADLISSGYIEYFEHSKWMKEKGAERIEKLAMQNSARVLVSNVFRREPEDSEPLQFLPSANLTINSLSQTFISSHGISQWWKPELDLQSKEYKHYS